MRKKLKIAQVIGAFLLVTTVVFGLLSGKNDLFVRAGETTFQGDLIIRNDFDKCQPRDKILNDENQPGFWNLRFKTWGNKNLLYGNAGAPDITYDPGLKGTYDIEVESRATNSAGGFGLKLSTEPDFTILTVPNEGATESRHFNVWMPFRKNVKLDNEKINIRYTGKNTYILNFKFTPVGKFTTLVPPDKTGSGFSTGVIYKDGNYIGWPTIVKTSKGEIIIVFSGDREAHVCPWGKIQMVRSSDNGKTWSGVITVNNTPADDRDAGIIETGKGTLLVSWNASWYFTMPSVMRESWKRHAEKMNPEIRKQWTGALVRRSEDNGKTWGAPSRTAAFAPHGPISLQDGRLLYVGTGAAGILAEESKDDGVTWQQIAKISAPASHYTEAHVVECGTGRLVAMFRNEDPDESQRFLGQSESDDGGKTWSMIHNTGIWGYPPHLIRLKDGNLLVSYSHRRSPYGQRACISYDNGKTWDLKNEVVLVDNAPDDDLGYPASAQLEDGSILTIYYQKDQPGEKPCLMGTYWRPDGTKK